MIELRALFAFLRFFFLHKTVIKMQVKILIFNKKTISLRKLIKNTFMLSLITPLNGMPVISLIKNFIL